MKKSGFTLVELLAVIIILAIISTIASLLVGKTITNSTEELTEIQIKNIEEAAKTYYLKEGIAEEDYNRKNYGTCVNVSYLVENGYIDKKVINPKNKEEITGSVSITYNSNKYRYDYQETICVEPPDLYDNTLTPVIYNGNSWVIADTSKEWYNYEKQEWANAVILNKDSNKKVGDPVTVDGTNPDVLAMLVWIPRYEYKIEGDFGKSGTSVDSPGEIEVNFINTNTKKASDTYRIHPAFNFGGTDISGIWVGKFELSHTTLSLSTTNNNLGCTNSTCINSSGFRILPNVQSLRYNNVSSFFYGIRSMSKDNNIFGIDKNITDTHMIKNSEWGAVAYLSQSKYGKYGNSDYTGRDKEVYINNSSDYYTGRSGGSYGGNVSSNSYGTYLYNGYLLDNNLKTEARYIDKIASTTGNIYGIYDMSGGSWEYVMGVFANSYGEKWSGTTSTSNSGFKGKVGNDGINIEGLEWPDAKYYDIYKAYTEKAITSTTACNGGICYGHALTETTRWYGDYETIVDSNNPWYIRGAYYNDRNMIGVYAYHAWSGGQRFTISTRVVLTPTT